MAANFGGDTFRFLVVGCGSIGKRHMNNLLSLGVGNILAFDPREDRRYEVETQFGIEVEDQLQNAWDREPNVALITAPTSVHVPLAMEAVQNGCHVFIEKPLSDRLNGIEPLLKCVREQNLITLVGCNMRFHPGLLTIKRLLEENAVGRVVAARVEFGQYLPDWHPWEDYRDGYSAQTDLGGGIILDGIHEIDYIRWLLGEVEAVACFAGKLSHLEIETEDTAAIFLRFANGVIGEVHLDYVQRVYSRTCQIIGDEGTIRWDYAAGEVRWFSILNKDWQVFKNPPAWESNQMYLDEMRHFVRCLRRKEKPALDVFEGKRVLEVALAAKTSNTTGQLAEVGLDHLRSSRDAS